MNITRKEALKFFKWRERRKIKKLEKLKRKNPQFKKEWNNFVEEIDKIMAYGDKNET